jgi:hypothetical protein
MKLVVLLLTFIILSLSLRSTDTYQQERNSGVWSDILTASPELAGDPEQYFMCGYALR